MPREEKYASPVDFMRDYVDLFNKQIDSPKKVFLREIEYVRDYEQSLLDYVINLSSQDHLDLTKYKEIEDILDSFHRQQYYDVIFYDSFILQYTKGVAFLLDRVDMEVSSGVFTNVDILFYFCSANLDLNSVIIKTSNCETMYLNGEDAQTDDLQRLVEFINQKLSSVQQSILYSSLELYIRYSPSDSIISDKRVIKYTLGHCVIFLFEECDKTNAEKYVLLTNLMGEFITKRIGNDEDISLIKEYSEELIKDV